MQLRASVAQNIYLLLNTKYGEYAMDETYGCSIWESDFENIYSSETTSWKERMSTSLKENIIKHEPRLIDVIVKIEIGQEEIVNSKTKNQTAKRRLDIMVTGNYSLANGRFEFVEKLFISPFSFE